MSSVQEELKEGIYEVFDNFFDLIQFYPFDPQNSFQDDVYGECVKKTYKDPVSLLAKPSETKPIESNIEDSNPLNGIEFTIPLKSFELAGVEVNIPELKKGRIIFNGTVYTIKSIVQTVNIQGVYLNYVFDCEEDRR